MSLRSVLLCMVGAVLAWTFMSALGEPLPDQPEQVLINSRTGVTECITITNGRDVPVDAPIRLRAAANGPLAPFRCVTVEEGTSAGTGCAGFTAEQVVYAGTLDRLAAHHDTYATGLPVNRDDKAYRVTATVHDTNDAQGLTATATCTWEATPDR